MPRKNRQDTESAEVAATLHAAELTGLRQALRDSQAALKVSHKKLIEVQNELATLLGMQDALTDASPQVIKVKKHNKPKESVAFAIASDWHVGERVDKSMVSGKNEYNPTIAKRRVELFFQNLLSLVIKERHEGPVEKLVLLVLGDLMTNTIHEDLAESNYLSPIEEVIFAVELLVAGISFLLEHGDFTLIEIICKVGNHGRTTKKQRVQTEFKTSYEVIVYRWAASYFQADKRVKFHINPGYHDHVEVFGTIGRVHHGHYINYKDGIGGVEIPLHKAIANWNTTQWADFDALGHWHQLILKGKPVMLNGSVIGYSPFSVRIKTKYEPPQQAFWLVHPGRGITVRAPVFVE